MVDDDRDDAMLVALVLAGEREAFGPLLRRYTPSVLRLCQRLVGSRTEAQDVAQEAALLAFLGLHRLQEPTRFGAWLHAIAAHVARTVLRRRHVISLDALDEATAQNASWLAALPTPEDVAAARDLHDAIVAALNDLSVVNREAVIGYYIDGYSYRELAMLLGVPISTIKGRLFFGRRQLRRVLQPLAADVLSLDRRPRIRKVKELPMAMSTLVEMHLTPPVRKMLRSTNRIVLLREVDAPLGLTIFVGAAEGVAIEQALAGGQPSPRLPDHLTLRVLDSCGAHIQRVVIHTLVEHTYYATITLMHGTTQRDVDARPSDALAVAARVAVPLYVTRQILETAGFDARDPQQLQAHLLIDPRSMPTTPPFLT